MAGGRPSKYSEALTDEICNRLAEGESLLGICKDAHMPCIATIWNWLDSKPGFLAKYARSRDAQAEYYANQIIDIADETPVTEMPDPDGGVTIRIDSAGIQRNRLRVDARKWVASKLLPKKYGEKVEQYISGPDGGPIQASITVELVKPSGNPEN